MRLLMVSLLLVLAAALPALARERLAAPEVVASEPLLGGKVRTVASGGIFNERQFTIDNLVRFRPHGDRTMMCAAFFVRGEPELFLRAKDRYPVSVAYVVGARPGEPDSGLEIDVSFMPGYNLVPGQKGGKEFLSQVSLACVALPLPWMADYEAPNQPAWQVVNRRP